MAWVRFVVLVEEELLDNENYCDTMRESWFSEKPASYDAVRY